MDRFIGNIRTAFQSNHDMDDSAGFVDDFLFLAGMALAAVAVSNWLGGAIMNKGADIAACVEGMNIVKSGDSAKNCEKQNHAKKNGASFKNNESYKNRFNGS